MQGKWKQRCFAWVLTGVMAVSALPSISLTAEAAAPNKLADFSFDVDAAGGVYDGGNAQAAMKGNCQTKVKYGTNRALYLDGKNSFINITSKDGGSILKGKENITVSYDMKPEKRDTGWTFFAAPNANKQTYEQEHYIAILHKTSETLVERYNNTSGRPGNNISDKEKSTGDGWMHVDLVVTETSTKLYINGESAGESTSTYKLSDILGSTGGILQVGKGNWNSGEYYKGLIDNFRIYDGILSDADITAQYEEFAATLDDIAEEERRQEEEEKKQQEEEAKRTSLQNDYDDLEILNSDDVRGNLALIKTGRYKSTITWTSSNPAVVTDSAAADSLYDGGVVTRPEPGKDPVKVTLTATLKSAYTNETKTKTFDVTVQPKEANLDTDYSKGYLWTNFAAHGGYEKIFFGYSEDGLAWDNINKVDGEANPILVNDAEGSDLGVRDPHILRSAEGDRYWILGTDLHAEGGGSGGSGWNQYSASKNLVVWESTDLVRWSEPRLVYAGLDTAGCIWAPEAMYDEATGDYVVYWSARDYSQRGTEDDALRVYVCRTRDFKSFSEPHVWLSEDAATGKEVNIIDSTIVKGDDGRFYRFSTSDWNTVVDVSDTLDTEDVLDVRNGETESKPKGSWKRLVTRSGSTAAGFVRTEGYTVYKLPDGKWCAMGDDGGYKAFVTDDLASGKFTAATATFANRFRHGTVMRLSAAEEERVLGAAYTPLLKSAVIGSVPENPTDLRGTDDHTATFSRINMSNREITSYVRRGTDLSAVPVTLNPLKADSEITVNGEPYSGTVTLDLRQDVEVEVTSDDKSDVYTIKTPQYSNNPVLPGQYADPDIDYFDGKFWIYPTTDGYPGWSGTKFHAFSSPDMVNWEDEGIILELKNENPGLNDKGVQIADSPWAVDGSAWAPTIEKKNGMYYFYYCGKRSGGASCIGVASSASPAGPYIAEEQPLLTVEMCKDAGVSMGQAIDPSIFTDDDGKSYILFGNGSAAIAELNEDMVSIKEGTLRQIDGLTDFRESVIVTKVGDKYHWTWTCDDANSPNYHVNYGTSNALIQEDGTVSVDLERTHMLSKNEKLGILGSGHQSVLHIKDAYGKDRYFMAYHRFYTPLNIFTDSFGVHRETCIDEIFFDKDGKMVITPTHEGVSSTVYMWKADLNKTSLNLAPGGKETLKATVTAGAPDTSIAWESDNTNVATVGKDGTVEAKAVGTATITATTSNGCQTTCEVTVSNPAINPPQNTVKVDKVELNKKSLTLGVKEKFKLTAVVSPKNASKPAVTWTSSKPSVAAVSRTGGVVTAKKTGKATITATADGVSKKCSITVKAAPKKISLSAKAKTLKKGKTFKIKLKLPKNTASNKITYTSSKRKVASVSSTGKIKALKKGTAVITVKTFNNKKAKIKITVK